MSQPTARRGGQGRVGTDAKRIEIKGDPAFFRRINYPAVAAGIVIAMAVYLVLGALVQAPGGALASQSGAYFAISVVAMYAGGLTAGMIEPKYGVLNGPLVAVVYILISFVVTFFHELQLVKVVGPLGLGPMRVDRVFAADIPQLFFSTLGGYTAGLIEQRFRAPRRKANRGKSSGG
jgi:hypothetical protein